MNMQKILKHKNITIKFLMVVFGLIGGLAYWYLVGCSSNSCPITSKWYLSTLYGGILGYLIGSLFDEKKKTEN